MGILDIFRRRKNKVKEEVQNTQIDKPINNIFSNLSDVISDEIIVEIKRINNIEYISDTMLKRMERYPKLVDLLLEGNVSSDVFSLLNSNEDSFYLPYREDDLKFIQFIDLNGKHQKLISLLNNRVSDDLLNETYLRCYIDLRNDFESTMLNNEIASFIPNVKINMETEKITKTSIYSPFILYFPKSKHKIIFHHYNNFITGDIVLDEDVIVQMSYDTFRYLDENVINKISRCKIIFSEKEFGIEKEDYLEEEVDYKLLKYNHLIYVIENSTLNDSIKDKLLYQIKNMYIENQRYFDLKITDKIIPYLSELDIEEIKRITLEFESNIKIYMSKKIEKPEFNATLHIDNFFVDFNNIPVNEIISFLNLHSEELRMIILKEPRVMEKLNIPEGLDEQELKKIIFLLSQRLNSTTMEFISSFDFDVQTFMSNSENDYLTSYDINYIVGKYGVFDYINEMNEVSIADIVGYDNFYTNGGNARKNILHTFERFFEKDGDGYHTRSLGLLKYSSGEQLINELKNRNNDTRDMRIRYIDDGKYIISGNGLHRFTVLRFHYLFDCTKKKKSDEELRELYKIPVECVSKTNYKNTYCNYLIQKANPDISYISFYDLNEIVIGYKTSEQKEVVDENQLVNLMRQSVDLLDSYDLLEVMQFYNKYNSFREFVDEYIPEILNKIEIQDKGGIKR